jgi:hypothetical protein
LGFSGAFPRVDLGKICRLRRLDAVQRLAPRHPRCGIGRPHDLRWLQRLSIGPEPIVRLPDSRAAASLVLLCLVAGCAVPSRPIASNRLPERPRGLVLVLDGAGGYPEATGALTSVVQRDRVPLRVIPFEWTHGIGRPFADMTDVEHARAQASQLAADIRHYRAVMPTTPISLVGYSAGTHVVLEATKGLEPDALERIVLLAPAVAADYDLAPAAARARHGIDVFTSRRDQLFLGLGTAFVGNADGTTGAPTAGRVGFDLPPLAGSQGVIAQRIRQHPWEPGVAWTGNLGGHSGTLRREYLRAFVVPLLSPPGGG